MCIKAGATFDLIKVAFYMCDFEMAISAKTIPAKLAVVLMPFYLKIPLMDLKFPEYWLAACLT